jgi:hypothetical protein
MWVASGVLITRMMSSSTRDRNTSNSRRPSPNSTGRPGRPKEPTVRSDELIVQPLAIVTKGVVELVVGAGDAPVQ